MPLASPQLRAVMKRCCIGNLAVYVLLHLQHPLYATLVFNPVTSIYYALAWLLLGLFFYI
jgi:hypothetical protein